MERITAERRKSTINVRKDKLSRRIIVCMIGEAFHASVLSGIKFEGAFPILAAFGGQKYRFGKKSLTRTHKTIWIPFEPRISLASS